MVTIFQSRKDQLCNNLTAVYEGLINTVKGRRMYAESWKRFGENAAAMCTGEIPELKQQFEEFSGFCNELYAIQNTFADKEERCAEDWRDVIERFAVVFRVNDEYIERKTQWREATEGLERVQKTVELESVKPSYDKNKDKLNQKLEEAKQNKRDYLRRYKRKLNQLINVKDAYNKFKVRRMRHGWILYAEAMKEASLKEMDVYAKMKNLLSSMKVGEQFAEAVTQQITTPAPAPVELPNIETAVEDAPEIPEPEPAPIEDEGNQDHVPANPLFDSFE